MFAAVASVNGVYDDYVINADADDNDNEADDYIVAMHWLN
mgnify:FL=1